MKLRRHGISTLIASQNEEALIAASIISFLPFSDEILVVDNGSSDQTKDIAKEVAAALPDKVRFFDLPYARHLHENRQFAFEQSKYSWIVRADGDYICHTSGYYNAKFLRDYLLQLNVPPFPVRVILEQATVIPDFDRCLEDEAVRLRQWRMPRVYRWFPGMRFGRMGRWEGVLVPKWWPTRLHYRIYWPNPIWMHCDVKSEESYYLRSFRADWRESGSDASLREFVADAIGARDSNSGNICVSRLAEEARMYFQREIVDRSRPFELHEMYYPQMLKVLMKMNAGYKAVMSKGGYSRTYKGPPDTAETLRLCLPLVNAPETLPEVFVKGA